MTSSDSLETSLESDISEALRLYNSGDTLGARTLFSQLNKVAPLNPEILIGLGMSTLSCGENTAAEALLRQATEINPQHDVAHRCLAIALLRKNDLTAAEQAAYRATQIAPHNPQSAFTLGIIKAALGDTRAAITCYHTALQHDPLYPEALLNLGSLALQSRDFKEAIQYLTTAVTTKHNFLDAYWKLFQALRESGSHDEAHALLQYLSTIAPDSKDVAGALALYESSGSKVQVGQSTMMQPENPLQSNAEIKSLESIANRYIDLPLVIQSAPELYELQEALMAHFSHIQATPGVIERPCQSISINPRFLSSLPLRDRLVRTKLASALALKAPSLRYTSEHISRWVQESPFRKEDSPISIEKLGGRDLVSNAAPLLQRKIRVGVCSERIEPHTTSSLFSELFAALPRDLFEISLFHATPTKEPLNGHITSRANAIYRLDNDLPKALACISSLQLDVLVYPDLDSSALTYLLAFARLAPIQCVLWGCTETTGIPTIDYFLAPQALVAGRAQSQFSEYLVTFPSLAASLETPHSSETSPQRAVGLPAEGTMFLCTEYPEGIHPGMDYVVQRILQGDRSSFIVFPERTNSTAADRLRVRLRAAMPDCMDQIFIMPVSSPGCLAELIEASDVVLDSLYSNSTLPLIQSLKYGRPIVTLPGKSMRSRTAGVCYRHVERYETIALSVEHYIQIALLLGRDTRWREQISAASYLAYEALSSQVKEDAPELARFFLLAINKQLSSSSPMSVDPLKNVP